MFRARHFLWQRVVYRTFGGDKVSRTVFSLVSLTFPQHLPIMGGNQWGKAPQEGMGKFPPGKGAVALKDNVKKLENFVSGKEENYDVRRKNIAYHRGNRQLR